MHPRSGGEFCFSATNYNRWFSVFVPHELHIEINEAAGASLGASCTLLRIAPDRAQRFKSTIERLGLMVQRQPSAFDSSTAVATTARKLAETVSEVFRGAPDTTPAPDRWVVPRKQIIRRAMDFVDQHAGEYLIVKDLANAAGVSERTLHAAFNEFLSVGPARYLKLRTLHQIRRILKAADPSMATVTEIATQLGVWELGRFAGDYHLLFGELPSDTLSRV